MTDTEHTVLNNRVLDGSEGRAMKSLVANRVPPGDRWQIKDDESDIVYGSLTDCLNQIYSLTKGTQFFVDAKQGEIYIEDGVSKPKPIKKYSL